MFEKNVWRYGAVDVQYDNGLMLHGLISDVDKVRGFIVNFGCPSQNADFIPRAKCSDQVKKTEFTIADRVETLCQPAADQPWRWYPSKLLNDPQQGYAFVDIEMGGIVVRKVVPVERVRKICSTTPLKVVRKYHKHAVRLSEKQREMLSARPKEFFEKWNKCTKTFGLRAEEGMLVYISTKTTPVADKDSKRHLFYIDSELRNSVSRGVKRNNVGEIVTASDESTVAPGKSQLSINTCLAAELLCEIFSYVDVFQHAKVRRVCRVWEAALQLSPPVPSVVIPGSHYDGHRLASVLSETVTRSTKLLALTNKHRLAPRYDDSIGRLRTVIAMLKAMKIRIPVIVVSDSIVWGNLLLDYSDPKRLAFYPQWRDVCEKLVLKEVAVRGLMEAQYPEDANGAARRKGIVNRFVDRGWGVTVTVTAGSISMKGSAQLKTLLDLLEKTCPEMTIQRLRMLRPVVGMGFAGDGILTVLRKWQLGDKRFTHDFPKGQSPLTGTSAEGLRSLKKLTLWALWYHMKENDLDM
ncbi:uncharacterized protein LOC129583239 [Paramacrobiotus metropolitanus]|uniref:uncharacterized protein LOC129583239 n=1 Tax=Paramacrobiotus metropolitanus TaxID=2943436 RepID=UPI0024464648|nr:uncharacterized protein LOC129583239 [Paramacrobiotus metropolitanus]